MPVEPPGTRVTGPRVGPIAVALVILVGAVFGRAAGNGFVDWDDLEYVTDNRHVQDGLSGPTLAWAFTTGEHSNWHPLTWISHAVDWEVFGADPAGHHLVSVGLHALNAVLLLLALFRMTGALWRSAAVAALFAVHPLHVESVVWAAERKDVLSTFLWMLVLLAYARQVERPSTATRILVPLLLGLGLMAKPMLVTLPFVLLLLDVWPLRRRFDARLLVEKVPLFVLAAASSVVTWIVQQRGGAVAALDQLPLASRFGNAAVACVTYLVETAWPRGLAVFYPYPSHLPGWKSLGACALLAAITAGVVAGRHRARYLTTGWLWYLGTLVPVIGIVQVGMQAHADRYTYVPLVGVFLMVAWGLPDLLGAPRHRAIVLGSIAAAAIAGCAILSWRQVGTWRDSETLFRHTLAVTSENYTIHNNLAGTLLRAGRLDEAILHLEEARRLRPGHVPTLSNLGLALQGKGRFDEAIALYREAVRLKPSHVEAWLNLGNALEIEDDLDGALAAFREAERLQAGNPMIAARIGSIVEKKRQPVSAADRARASYTRGNASRDRGRLDAAIDAFREAIRLDPGFVDAHHNLGIALALRGETAEAARELAEVLRLTPGDATAHFNLGALLAKQGRLDDAVSHFEAALRIDARYEGARRALEETRRRIAATSGSSDGPRHTSRPPSPRLP